MENLDDETPPFAVYPYELPDTEYGKQIKKLVAECLELVSKDYEKEKNLPSCYRSSPDFLSELPIVEIPSLDDGKKEELEQALKIINEKLQEVQSGLNEIGQILKQ